MKNTKKTLAEELDGMSYLEMSNYLDNFSTADHWDEGEQVELEAEETITESTFKNEDELRVSENSQVKAKKDKAIRKIQIADYVNVIERAAELGCNAPKEVTILPNNFSYAKTADELVYMNSAATVRKLLRLAGILESRIEKGEKKYPQLVQESIDWIGPLIFIKDYALVPVVIGIISNYLTDYLKGKNNKIKQHIIVPFVNSSGVTCYKVFQYEGSLADMPKVLGEAISTNTDKIGEPDALTKNTTVAATQIDDTAKEMDIPPSAEEKKGA